MRKSAESAGQDDCARVKISHGLDLELPAAPDFMAMPPRADPEGVLKLCWLYLPKITSQPGFWEARAAERCPAEFDLEHPERVPASYPAALLDEILPA